MSNQYYSMKDMAEKLNVSKQRVYRCIKKNNIKEAHTDVVSGNTVLMYDDNAFIEISDIINNGCSTSSETHETHNEVLHEAHNETHEALYETLLKQLEVKDKQIAEKDEQLKVKDKQIAEKDEQLKMIIEALAASQKLNAIDKQKLLGTEAKQDEVQVQEVSMDHVEPKEPVKKKWWQKIFK